MEQGKHSTIKAQKQMRIIKMEKYLPLDLKTEFLHWRVQKFLLFLKKYVLILGVLQKKNQNTFSRSRKEILVSIPRIIHTTQQDKVGQQTFSVGSLSGEKYPGQFHRYHGC